MKNALLFALRNPFKAALIATLAVSLPALLVVSASTKRSPTDMFGAEVLVLIAAPVFFFVIWLFLVLIGFVSGELAGNPFKDQKRD